MSDRRMPRTALATVVVTAVLLTVVSVSSFAAADPNPSGSKTGAAVSTGSTTEVASGGSVDWTVTGANTGGTLPATVTMTDAIATDQTFDPAGTDAPDGWVLDYSNTGTSGPFGDAPGASTRAVRATSPLLPPGLLGAAGQMSSLTSTSHVSMTNGDGWIPIITDTRIFNIMHHTHPGQPDVNCTERSTGATCVGYPLELGVYAAGDLRTPQSPRGIIDSSNRLWIPAAVDIAASTNDEAGFFCLDIISGAPCATAWFPLTTVTIGSGGTNINLAPVGGISQNGDRMFMTAVRNVAGATAVQSLCLDTAALSSCGVVDMNSIGAPAWNYSLLLDGRAPWVQTQTVGSQSYFTVDYGGSQTLSSFDSTGNRIFCVDMVSVAPCTGWTVPAVPNTMWDNLIRLTSLLMENPSAPGQVCTGTTVVDNTLILTLDAGFAFVPSLVSRVIDCFSATGVVAPASVPPGLQALVNSTPSYMFQNYSYQQPVAIAYEEVRTSPGRTVVPMSVAALNGYTAATANSWALCYDTATSGACAGFGSGGSTQFPAVNSGAMMLYGFSTDDAGCLWGLGDQGWLFSASPSTGATPCTQSSATVTVGSAASLYCRTASPTVTWQTATLSGLTPGDVGTFYLDVLDSSGNPVPGFTDLYSSTPTISLSGLPGGPEYQFEARVVAENGSSWSAVPPVLSVAYTGPPMELCLRTITPAVCNASPTATNAATVAVADADATESVQVSASLAVTGITACTSTTASTVPTSSTAPPSTSPPSTSPPSSEVPSTSTPTQGNNVTGTSTPGSTMSAQASQDGSLARTGTTVIGWLSAAVAAMLFGLALVMFSRRRSSVQ